MNKPEQSRHNPSLAIVTPIQQFDQIQRCLKADEARTGEGPMITITE